MSPQSHGKHHSDILFAVGVVLAVAFVYVARDVLLLIYVSALLAVVIGPALDAIGRIRVGGWSPGRGVSILVFILLGLGLAALFFTFALPPIFRDLRGFAADLPRRVYEIQQKLGNGALAEQLDFESLERHASAAAGGAIGLFRGVFGGVFAFLSAVVLTAYFALDGGGAFEWMLSMISEPERTRLRATLLRAELRLRRWLLGQATLMLILGLSATVVFGLLRLKYFYALGVLAGVLNIVPVIGPIASLVFAGLIAAFDSPAKLVAVLGFYFFYQQVENAFLTPRIMKYSVNLPPLAVVVALTLGGAMAGILGALIAVPTAALLAVLAEEYLVKKGEPLAETQLSAAARE
jgi:predicted PurR-regulated permease PerM